MESIPRCSNAPVSLGAECKKKQYLEEIEEGLKVKVLDISDDEYGDNITSLTVRIIFSLLVIIGIIH